MKRVYDELYQRIHTAPNAHTVLTGLVDEIIAAYRAEELTIEEHDALIRYTITISRQLARGLVNHA